MQLNIWKFKNSSIISLCAVVALASVIGSQSEAMVVNNQKHVIERHLITFPEFSPRASSDCNLSAAAYASAIVALNDARRVADEAYRRWYECEMQGGEGGNGPRGITANSLDSEIPPAELSVLVDTPSER
ncbi:MAG: hypothetical protein L7U72_01120 [Rubripirellula sp.]|nr:hypothetical protein [Rubripirellula sp.]